jgi:hypothetical protein
LFHFSPSKGSQTRPEQATTGKGGIPKWPAFSSSTRLLLSFANLFLPSRIWNETKRYQESRILKLIDLTFFSPYPQKKKKPFFSLKNVKSTKRIGWSAGRSSVRQITVEVSVREMTGTALIPCSN